MVIQHSFGFYFFLMISSSCRDIWFYVILLRSFVFRCLVTDFNLCVSNSNEQNIFDQRETTNQDYSHQYVIELES